MVLIRHRKKFLKCVIYSGGKKRTVIRSAPIKKDQPKKDTVKDEVPTENEAMHMAAEHVDIPMPGPSSVQFPGTEPSVDIDNVQNMGEGNNGYTRVREGRLNDWKAMRRDILQAYLSMECAPSTACLDCGEESPLYRCIDCCCWDVVCESCLYNRHQRPHLHVFEAWKNDTFICCNLETAAWKLLSHSCDTLYMKQMVIVDEKGWQHNRHVQFCKCEPEAVTLVRYNLWPTSAKFPRIALHIDLLKWANGLLLESHVSIKSFCEALKARASKHHQGFLNSQVKDIYKSLIEDTMEEFRHFVYCVEHPSTHFEHLDDGTQCPACFSVPTKVFSFDADFQLVRKASSGRQWSDPKHAEKFFLSQNTVDTFIENYDQDRKKLDVDCSEFKAGSMIRSKKKNTKLAETAVFGSSCRHEFPKYFFSLKHGERLGYAVFLLKKLLGELPEDHKVLYIMYDIACNFESHLKKHSQICLDKVCFSIPVFHSYGHKIACQVLYGPRRIEGIGLTDGECLERLWSYLGKFSKITKEMTPENRIDLLVDGLMHYANKIKYKLGTTLVGKFEKATELEKTSTTALQELLEPLTGITDENVKVWMMEEKRTFTKTNNSNSNVSFSQKEQYSLAVEKLYNLRKLDGETNSTKGKKCKELDIELKKLQRKYKVTSTNESDVYKDNIMAAKEKQRMSLLIQLHQNTAERHFLLELMKKYAKGQAVAVRLSKQIKKVSAKLRQNIEEYNNIGGRKTNLPLFLSFEEVKSHESAVWQHLEQPLTKQSNPDVPVVIKRQAIQLHCIIERAVEEQQLLKTEMESAMNYYRHQYCLLQGAIACSDLGVKSVLIKECLSTEFKLFELATLFKRYLKNVLTFHELSDSFGICLDTAENFSSLNDGNSFDDDDDDDDDDEEEEEEEEEDYSSYIESRESTR